MSEPLIAQKSPIAEEVETGKTYFWCSCGHSKNQPFCDGSHKDTEFLPAKYQAEKSEKVFFCCCKKTGTPPFCDGTHQSI